MKYIDADKLKAEIERQMNYYDEKEMKAWDDYEQSDEDALWYQGHRKMCSKLLSFLDTLQGQTVTDSKKLEEEINKWLDGPSTDLRTTARHFAKWGAEHLKK